VRVGEREAADGLEVGALELGVADVGSGVDEREQRACGGDRRRNETGVDDRGAPGGAGVERVGRRDLQRLRAAVRLGVEEEAAERLGELARAAARDDVGAGADGPGAVAGSDRVGRRAGAGADDPVRGDAAPASPGSTIGGRREAAEAPAVSASSEQRS
jgi:hypothetical protein